MEYEKTYLDRSLVRVEVEAEELRKVEVGQMEGTQALLVAADKKVVAEEAVAKTRVSI